MHDSITYTLQCKVVTVLPLHYFIYSRTGLALPHRSKLSPFLRSPLPYAAFNSASLTIQKRYGMNGHLITLLSYPWTKLEIVVRSLPNLLVHATRFLHLPGKLQVYIRLDYLFLLMMLKRVLYLLFTSLHFAIFSNIST